MNKSSYFVCLQTLFVSVIVFTSIVTTSGLENQTHVKTESNITQNGGQPSVAIGRAIKDNSSNGLEKSKRDDQKNKESKRKESNMYDIMSLHQMNAFNDFNANNKEVKDLDKKEKGKLQTVGGVVGEIIAVLVSEVVKLFGNMVSDVAREVTAHGFVSIFKQFTDLTGISLPEF